ncbi:hypothetical protein BCR39DRAFT_521237 [Naematelia encephala]|uniref:Uncharacterized protein n=1 Tax=Naematelia encephala TaxID=71784 RepID=A0A1Y2BE39_9TREE|nr:hypothetical protein BCR39DRAFT_521237 [Naematelia encephala]
MPDNSQSMIPDLRPPRSPRRFFSFSKNQDVPPLPPLPTVPPLPSLDRAHGAAHWPKSHGHNHSSSYSSTSSTKSPPFIGAQIVRRPSEAVRGMKTPVTPVSAAPTAAVRHTRKQSTEYMSYAPSTAPVLPNLPSMYRQSSVSSYLPSSLRSPDSQVLLSPESESESEQDVVRDYRRDTYRLPPKAEKEIRRAPSMDAKRWGREMEKAKENENRLSLHARASSADLKRDRRSTIKPPAKSSLPLPTPFQATLLSKTIKASPTAESTVLVVLDFGYSLNDEPRTNSVTLPLEALRHAGGYLCSFVESYLEEEHKEPEMTDGSSAEGSDLDSEYGLGALLKDEYFRSLWISTPDQPNFEIPALSTLPGTSKKRAQTRNQYTQHLLPHFPSPGSSFTPPAHANSTLSLRRNAPKLSLDPKVIDGGGLITELRILLYRDAGAWHAIAGRLATGHWSGMEGRRRRVEDEAKWAGMSGLVDELAGVEGRKKSLVLRGGEGYI